MKEQFVHFLSAVRNGFRILRRSDPLILASSTAFFTTFSLSPILVILVNILGFYFRDGRIKEQLFEKVGAVVGTESASQVRTIVENFGAFQHHGYAVLGFIFLFFVATTLMHIIKLSLNRLWGVKRKLVKRLRYTFTERLTAGALILAIGVLFILALLLDTTVSIVSDHLRGVLRTAEVYIVQGLNIIFSLAVVTVWFTILYKVLPDAHVSWRVAVRGGLLTAVLFNSGKWILGKVLLYNRIATIFGASASLALILLFIFYASLILYFGAAVTYAHAEMIGQPIRAGKYSEEVRLTVVDRTGETDREDPLLPDQRLRGGL